MALINDENFICYKTPGSLQNHATVTVAAYLCRIQLDNADVNGSCLAEAQPEIKFIEYQLPKTIENIIEACVELVRIESLKWASIQYVRAFNYYDPLDVFLRKYFDLISWQSSYHIDYDQTAKNLLTCSNLDLISKYKLACLHCFEHEIRNIWPDVRCNQNLREYVTYRNDLCAYWYRRMEKEFPNIQCSLSLNEDDEIEMLENHIVLGRITIKSSLIYLWKRLKTESQVGFFIRMVENETLNALSIKLTLPLFSEMQLAIVFERCGPRIICSLVRGLYENDADYILRVWRRVRNVVTGRDFFHMLIGILDKPRTIFYDIWHFSHDHLKRYVSNCDHLYVLLRILYRGPFLKEPNIKKSIKELIRCADSQILKSFWRNNWFVLIEVLNLDDLLEFMMLCFKNDEDIAKFKQTHLAVYNSKIAHKSFNLIHLDRFDELMEFLNFSSSDVNVVEDLKKQIVLSWKSFKYFLANVDNPGSISSFLNFARDIRSPVDDREIGQNILASFFNSEFIIRAFICGRLDCVRKLVSLLIPKNDTNDVKARLVENFHRVLINGKFLRFDIKNCDEFLLWCFNDDQHQLNHFKLALPIDDIFRILFEKSFSNSAMEDDTFSVLGSYSDNDESINNDFSNNVNRTLINLNGRIDEGILIYSDDSDDEMETSSDSGNEADFSRTCFHISISSLQLINNFLSWYFPCRQGIDEFKMKKIEERDVSPLCDLFASNDECSIEIVLNWFFNGDDERIKVFKSLLPDSN